MKSELPIIDNHIHLRRDGEGIKAAKKFQKAGGTHLILVNLPTWNYGISLTDSSDFRKPFEECISLAKEVEEETEIKTYPIVGVHPAELTKWKNAGKSLKKTFNLMKKGIDLASKYIQEEKAIALGEVGRPHYSVSEKVMDFSNELLKYSFQIAKDNGFPIQLHMESMKGKKDIRSLSGMIKEVGLNSSKVIKHFSNPLINEFEEEKIIPSIIAKKKNLKKAFSQGNRFLMETDYLDDPKRPGAVLGPKNVPRKTKWLLRENIASERDILRIHKKIPESVYGIQLDI